MSIISDGSHVVLLSLLRGVLDLFSLSSSSSPRIIDAISAGSAVCRLSLPPTSVQCDSSSRWFIMSIISDGSHIVLLTFLRGILFGGFTRSQGMGSHERSPMEDGRWKWYSIESSLLPLHQECRSSRYQNRKQYKSFGNDFKTVKRTFHWHSICHLPSFDQW